MTSVVTRPGPRKCRVLCGRHTAPVPGFLLTPGCQERPVCAVCHGAVAGRGRRAEVLPSSDLFVYNGLRRACALQGRSLGCWSRPFASQNHRAAWDLCQAMTPQGLLRGEAPWGPQGPHLLGADGEEGSCMDWPPLGPSARILKTVTIVTARPGGGTSASSSAMTPAAVAWSSAKAPACSDTGTAASFSVELRFSDRPKKILDRSIDLCFLCRQLGGVSQ